MRRRIVITGLGMINPLGTDVDTVWRRVVEGESSVGQTTVFDASNFPTKISSEVRDWDITDIGEDPQDWIHRGRHTKFAAGAAHKAIEDSGIQDTVDPTRFGVYLGAGEGQQDFNSFARMMSVAIEDGQLNVAKFTK